MMKKVKMKEIKNEKKESVCRDCPAYSPGCCTVDNMPAEAEDTCKFAGVFKK
ncbi:MAG: hypothetical protein WBK86_07575 [Halanaerobiales bacterium]